MSIYDPLAKALGIESSISILHIDVCHDPEIHGDCIPSPFKGQKHTPESCAMISQAHIGKVYSEETLEKMSFAKIGKKASDKTKQKMSENRLGSKNSFFGKKHSEETIEKIKHKTRQYEPWNKGIKGCTIHTQESRDKRGLKLYLGSTQVLGELN
jgi:hypothetical protein